jgi:hypothetical protein
MEPIVDAVIVIALLLGAWFIASIVRGDRRQRRERQDAQQREAAQRQAEAATEKLAVVERLEYHWRTLTAPLDGNLSPETTAAYKGVLRAAIAQRSVFTCNAYFEQHILPVAQRAYAEAGVYTLGMADGHYERSTDGTLEWRPQRQPITIPEALRFHHAYVIGATGTGKTTLLKHLILNDIRAGAGVTVLTPDKSFLTDHLLPCLDPKRANDLIYFNPEDGERPVSFNPLTLAPTDSIDRKADELLTLFKRAIGETSPRMDAILRNSFYALLERTGSTLADMYDLLSPTKPQLRNAIISTTRDERTREFFRDEFPTFPKDAARPILNRLDSLTRAAFLKNALCQPDSTLTFTQAMREHKVILCNLSDGALGTQNATLLGQLLIAAIQQALFARDSQPESQRVPHYLYIDEFETYTSASTTALSEILTRARKLKLGITVAHQHLKQLPPELIAGLLGNVAVKVVFRVSPEDAAKLCPHLGLPDPTSLTTKLGVGWAWAGIDRDSWRVNIPPDTYPRHDNLVPALIAASRTNYGRTPAPRPEPTPAATGAAPHQEPAKAKKSTDDFLE